MSHIRVHSQGNVPFSWEDKPGVSKVTHFDNKCPNDVRFYALNSQAIPPDPSEGGGSSKILVHDRKVPPPPPCSIQLLTKRSSSLKGLGWWQEDPFLAAYKECTKNAGKNGKLLSSEGRKSGNGSKARKKKITFSCKNSSDVREDNLVRLSSLPPLPKDRFRGRQEVV